MMFRQVYLDHASTSFPKAPGVPEEAARFLREDAGNGGRSGHRLALAARAAVEATRRAVAEVLGARDANRVTFASGATDALNVALKGVLREGDRALVGPEAHNSVLRPLGALARDRKVQIEEVKADDLLRWDLDDLRRLLARRRTKVVVASLASNVTGTIEPIPEIAKLARSADALLLVDAAQGLGSVPLDVERTGADLVAWSGHKGLLGPTGTGGLYVRAGVNVRPLREGGTGTRSEREEQPESLPEALEAGTPNACGLAPLAKGVAHVLAEGPRAILARELALAVKLARALEGLRGVRVCSAARFAEDDEAERTWPRAAGIVSFVLGALPPEETAALLDAEHGIAVRAGLHCAPRAHRRLATLPAGTVRASVGPFTTEADVSALVEAVGKLVG